MLLLVAVIPMLPVPKMLELFAEWGMWLQVVKRSLVAEMEIFPDGAATRLTVPNNTSWGFEVMCVARRSDGTSAVLTSIGGIKNDAGVVVVIAAVAASTVVADGSAGAIVAGSLVVDADDPNNALRVLVTGVAAQAWRWCARCRLVELGF